MAPPTEQKEHLTDFLTPARAVILPISSLSVMFFVYGLYMALFISYIHIVRQKRKRHPEMASSMYLYPTVALFLVTTLVVIGNVMQRSTRAVITFDAVKSNNFDRLKAYLTHDRGKTASTVLINVGQVVLNIFADYILIHRCYLIWGSKKRIALPLTLASVVTNIIGIIGSLMYSYGVHDTRKIHQNNIKITMDGDFLQTIFLIMSVIVNSALTLVTAGRIWWVYRHRGQGQVGKSPLGTIVRILIESGAIYPIFTIVHVASVNSLVLKKLPFDLRATAVQTAGIAPTLIVVRVQSGKSVESTIHHCETQGEVLSEFRVTSCPAHSMGFSENTQLEMEKPSQVHALEMKPFSRSRGESSAGGSFKDNGLKDENAV